MLSIHPFIHPASQPSIHPSVHPSIRPSVHQVKKSPSKSKSKQTKRLMDVCAQQRRGKNDKTLISTAMDLAKTTELPFSHGCGPCGSKFEMSMVAWERSATSGKSQNWHDSSRIKIKTSTPKLCKKIAGPGPLILLLHSTHHPLYWAACPKSYGGTCT